jgi:hypothetical protein
MKSHIKMSTFDLFDVWQAIRHAITNQLKELRYVRVSQQMRTPLDISGTLFEAVRGWVSHSALRKVQEQRHLLQGPRMTLCSQRFTSSHGLPCSHMLKRLEEAGQNLLIEHFHPHWHLKRETTRPRPVLEPRRVASHAQEMRRQARPESSTRREPSGFEMIKEGKRAPSKCSRCHVVGHTMTSKDCPLRFKKLLVPPADVPGPAPHSGPAPGLITSAVSNAAESGTILQSFEDAVKALEGDGIQRKRKQGHFESYGNVWEEIVGYEFLLAELEKANAMVDRYPDSEHFKVNINLGWKKLDEYYKLDETPIYYTSLALHPAYRWGYFETVWSERSAWISKAKDVVQSVWDRTYKTLDVAAEANDEPAAKAPADTVLLSLRTIQG